MDEIDKMSPNDSKEIFGVLTHLLDEEQNSEFQDMYFKGIKIDMSKAMFVISFNDLEEVNHIVSDRMRIITVENPSFSEKIKIVEKIMLPEIIENNKNENIQIEYDENSIRKILHNTDEGDGLRLVRENIKKIVEYINLSYYSKKLYYPEVFDSIIDNKIFLSEDIINLLIPKGKNKEPYPHFYT